MNDSYLLECLVRTVRAYKKAKQEYYIHPGDPKKDRIKASYLSELNRRKQDLDSLLKKIQLIHPVPEET